MKHPPRDLHISGPYRKPDSDASVIFRVYAPNLHGDLCGSYLYVYPDGVNVGWPSFLDGDQCKAALAGVAELCGVPNARCDRDKEFDLF